MDASVKEEPSEVTEEMNALYEDVMENGVEMETIEVDDSLPSTDEPSCSSRLRGATTTPRRETTKIMTINVRRTLKGVVVTPIYSARSMWSQKATPRAPARGTSKHFTVIVPRRTPFDVHFQQPQGQFAARSPESAQANIGTSAAPIVLDCDEASAEGSEEQRQMMRDELPTSAKKDDAMPAPALAVEAGPSPAAGAGNKAPIEVDIDEPTDKAAEAPTDAVQAPTKERDAEMVPRPSNSVDVVGPMQPLAAVLSAKKAQKALRRGTDRLREQNRVAAHRYRRRRHEERKKAQRELVEMERRNAELKTIMALLESQISLLRESIKAE